MSRAGRLPREGIVERLTHAIDTLGDAVATGDLLVLLNEVRVDLEHVRDTLDPEGEFFDQDGPLLNGTPRSFGRGSRS